jgi:uncharacterized protein (DUF697 family)
MKKLPKAILRTSEDMRSTAEEAEATHVVEARPADAIETPAAAPPAAAARDNVIELAPNPAVAAARSAPITIPAAPPLDERATARRRSRAQVIVERHATYAAFGGCIPVPVLNASGVMAIIVRMVNALSKHYGVPFQRERTRAVVLALMGGTTPVTVAVGAASTILLVIPGTQLLGLAISSVTASACTRDIGLVFIDIFEKGATLPGTPVDEKR